MAGGALPLPLSLPLPLPPPSPRPATLPQPLGLPEPLSPPSPRPAALPQPLGPPEPLSLPLPFCLSRARFTRRAWPRWSSPSRWRARWEALASLKVMKQTPREAPVHQSFKRKTSSISPQSSKSFQMCPLPIDVGKLATQTFTHAASSSVSCFSTSSVLALFALFFFLLFGSSPSATSSLPAVPTASRPSAPPAPAISPPSASTSTA
mmetsp:Transcript_26036/g.74662  ORF Transcript_26036/g.74662 Transcript_26036/m.74662 type:complete len:207 (+) Transcript_26036:402-1022(+)